jgi:hypothetical protein
MTGEIYLTPTPQHMRKDKTAQGGAGRKLGSTKEDIMTIANSDFPVIFESLHTFQQSDDLPACKPERDDGLLAIYPIATLELLAVARTIIESILLKPEATRWTA